MGARRDRRDGAPGARGACSPSTSASLAGAPGIADHAAGEGPSRSARRATRSLTIFTAERLRLLPGAGHRARKRSATSSRWTRPSGLAAWMLDHDTDSYYKISRAFVERASPSGNLTPDRHPRQRHAVLAHGHRRLRRAVVLGVRTVSGRTSAARRGSSAGQGSRWLHDVPRRDLRAAPRSWVETVYPGLAYFNQVDRGGHFAAWEERSLLRRDAGRIQLTALIVKEGGIMNRLTVLVAFPHSWAL